MDHELPALAKRSCPGCGWQALLQDPAKIATELNPNFIGRDRPQVSLLSWSECAQCRLLFVNQCPPEEWYLQRYENSGETDPDLDALAARTAINLWNKKMPRSLKSILEIGCGQGHFLRGLKKQGIQICGTEPNRSLRQMSGLSHDEILSPEDLPRSSKRFEALSLQLSLEHLYQPREVLAAAAQHLEDHAFLFLLYHSTSAWPHRILGKKSPLYDIQHLQLFDPISLKLFLESVGFRVQSDEAYSNQYPLAYWGKLLGLQTPSELGKLKVSLKAGNRVCVAQFQRIT